MVFPQLKESIEKRISKKARANKIYKIINKVFLYKKTVFSRTIRKIKQLESLIPRLQEELEEKSKTASR